MVAASSDKESGKVGEGSVSVKVGTVEADWNTTEEGGFQSRQRSGEELADVKWKRQGFTNSVAMAESTEPTGLRIEIRDLRVTKEKRSRRLGKKGSKQE